MNEKNEGENEDNEPNKKNHAFRNNKFSREQIIRMNPLLGFKKIMLNNPSGCYFARPHGTIHEHHLSYIPEEVVYLSDSNHKKVHFLMERYHHHIIKKDQEIKFLLQEVSRLKKLIAQDPVSMNPTDDNVFITIQNIIRTNGVGSVIERPLLVKMAATMSGYTDQHIRKMLNRFVDSGVLSRQGKLISME